jgi:hypothetical protein
MKFHKIRLTHMSFQILEPKRNTRRRPPHPRNRREKMIQDVTGTLLYYGCAVDSTILPSLSSLATEQAKPTVKTKAMVMQLLDYLATQEEAIISYNASDMIFKFTVMRDTQTRKEHEAAQEDISSYQTTTAPLRTAAQY